MKKDTSRNLTTLSEAKNAQAFAYNKEHYGVVIRNYRKKMGFTQQQIAESIGVSKSHIANWEAGRARPDLNLVPALCLTLGIDASTFFGMPCGRGGGHANTSARNVYETCCLVVPRPYHFFSMRAHD